jgi:hypothetical protein
MHKCTIVLNLKGIGGLTSIYLIFVIILHNFGKYTVSYGWRNIIVIFKILLYGTNHVSAVTYKLYIMYCQSSDMAVFNIFSVSLCFFKDWHSLEIHGRDTHVTLDLPDWEKCVMLCVDADGLSAFPQKVGDQWTQNWYRFVLPSLSVAHNNTRM